MNKPRVGASSLEIANEFIRRGLIDGRSVTSMQVQKLVYFAHGMCLATLGHPLVSDSFEAWKFGPVARPLYEALRQYGGSPIARLIRYGDDSPFDHKAKGVGPIEAKADLLPSEQRIIGKIYDRFGNMPAFRLSALTHDRGGPWDNVYRDGDGQNDAIPNDALQEYFARLAAPGTAETALV